MFLGLFIKITWELFEDSKLGSIDQKILVWLSNLRVNSLNGPAVDVTALGSAAVLSIFTILGLVLLLLNKDRRGATYLGVGSLMSGVGSFAIKRIFTRPRPNTVPHLVEVSGFSYPSGHSIAATSFYLLLMFLTWRHYRTVGSRFVLLLCALVVICSVCFSRLYLGVHYPSDVLSGMFLGAAWVCLLTSYFLRFED